MTIQLRVNNKTVSAQISPGQTLLDVLRALGYKGVKKGCESGTCGSCVVLVDGVPKYSCLLFAAGQEGHEITTIEGLGSLENPHPLMQAFAEEGAVQCGYCVPGMIMSAKALLDSNLNPTEDEVRDALDGHLCRCTGYVKQVKAVLKAAKMIREGGGTDGKE